MDNIKKWSDGDIITSQYLNQVDEKLDTAATSLEGAKTELLEKIVSNQSGVAEVKKQISKCAGEIQSVKQQLVLIQDKLREEGRKDQQRKEISNEAPNIDAPEEHIFVNTKKPLEANGTIKAKKVELGAFHLMGGNLTVESTGDVVIGTLSSVGAITNPGESKAALHIKSGGFVSIDKALMQSDGASAIRIGALNGNAPKAITLNGLDFSKALTGPAVYIDNIAQDGVITISNSIFINVRNVLEIISASAMNRFKLMFINCRVVGFNKAENAALSGLVLLRDTGATSVETFYSRRVFGSGIGVISIANTTVGKGLLESAPVEDIIATGNDKQLVAGVTGNDIVVPFGTDKNKWPMVTIQ